jgi:hypothetical protein
MYIKRAMPVHPKVLEQDFESSEGALDDIDAILHILRSKESKSELDQKEKDFISSKLTILWFEINKKRGINLRDREKLLPVFQELDRLIGTYGSPSYLYRGVNLTKFDPLMLSELYGNSTLDTPFKPNSKISQELEYLAYGLRSWSSSKASAHTWATENYNRDRIIFQIQNPQPVLDGTAVINFFKSGSMFDRDEYILNLKDPKVVSVNRYDETYDFFVPDDKLGNRWEVTIKDN